MYTEITKNIHAEFNNACEKFTTAPDDIPKIGMLVHHKIAEYKKRYPLHKIITKNKVIMICKKYELVLGAMERFAGYIPEKNMAELRVFPSYTIYYRVADCDYDTLYEAEKASREHRNTFGFKTNPKIVEKKHSGSFYVCAAKNEFILRDEDVDLTINTDPIILFCPARDWNKDVFIIVTAWGEEASDENIRNEKMN